MEPTAGGARPPLRPDVGGLRAARGARVSRLPQRAGEPWLPLPAPGRTSVLPGQTPAHAYCAPRGRRLPTPVGRAPGSPLPSPAGLTSLPAPHGPGETSTPKLRRRVSREKRDAAFGRRGRCVPIGSPALRGQRLDRSEPSSPASCAGIPRGLASGLMTSGFRAFFRAPFCASGNLARTF